MTPQTEDFLREFKEQVAETAARGVPAPAVVRLDWMKKVPDLKAAVRAVAEAGGVHAFMHGKSKSQEGEGLKFETVKLLEAAVAEEAKAIAYVELPALTESGIAAVEAALGATAGDVTVVVRTPKAAVIGRAGCNVRDVFDYISSFAQAERIAAALAASEQAPEARMAA
jgi:hypothetical protein